MQSYYRSYNICRFEIFLKLMESGKEKQAMELNYLNIYLEMLTNKQKAALMNELLVQSDGILLERNSQVESQNEEYREQKKRERRTRLWFDEAVLSRNIPLLNEKMELKDFAFRNHHRQNILHLAAKTGDIALMIFLLSKLSVLIARRKEEAVHWEDRRARGEPISADCPRIIEPLNDIDYQGNSALDIAIKEGFSEVVAALKRAGGIAFKQQPGLLTSNIAYVSNKKTTTYQKTKEKKLATLSPTQSMQFAQIKVKKTIQIVEENVSALQSMELSAYSLLTNEGRNKLFEQLNQLHSPPKNEVACKGTNKELYGEDIQRILKRLFGDSIYIVHPDSSTHQTLWSKQTTVCPTEGYVDFAKTLLGFATTDGEHIMNGLFIPGQPLDKPIVMILNTGTGNPEHAQDAKAEGGIHWV